MNLDVKLRTVGWGIVSILLVFLIFSHIYFLWEFKALSPRTAAAIRMVQAEFSKGAPAKNAGQAIGRQIGQSMISGFMLSAAESQLTGKSIVSCYLIGLGIAPPPPYVR